MKLSVLFTTLGALASIVSAAPSAPKMASSLSERSSLPRLGGLNIAGCDFGMTTWGYSGTVWCPGQDQFAHFANQGANLFRVPVGWQYLQSSPGSGSLDGSTVATYEALVDAALATGAYAIIDLHNYARWNGGVVGADGPTAAQFAQFWSLIATKYKDNSRVIFGLMNEPHDLDIGTFASACQAAVTAIRAAGATTQTILLPGNSWDNAQVWSSGANAAMLAITDPSSSDNSKLVMDVHKYFDSDGSGSSATCTNDGTDLIIPLVAYLKAQGRQAMVTEFGGGNNSGCVGYVSSFLQYLTDNSDVIVGWTAWSAGAFDSTYALDLTPNTDGSDQLLFTGAIKNYLPGNSGSTSSTSTSAAATSTTTKASTTSTSTTSTSTTSTSTTTTSTSTTTTKAATSTTTQASSCVVASTTSTKASTTTSANSGSSSCTVAKWGQCGGQSYTGCTTCASGSTCTYSNDWYSQCL